MNNIMQCNLVWKDDIPGMISRNCLSSRQVNNNRSVNRCLWGQTSIVEPVSKIQCAVFKNLLPDWVTYEIIWEVDASLLSAGWFTEGANVDPSNLFPCSKCRRRLQSSRVSWMEAFEFWLEKDHWSVELLSVITEFVPFCWLLRRYPGGKPCLK